MKKLIEQRIKTVNNKSFLPGIQATECNTIGCTENTSANKNDNLSDTINFSNNL